MKAGFCEVSRFRRWSKVDITIWAMRKSDPAAMDSQPACRTKGPTSGGWCRQLNPSLCSYLATSSGLRTGLRLDLDPVESSITKSRSASEDPRGVDMRFDPQPRPPGAARMSLLDVVALLDQHPNGAIQYGQFGEAGRPGLAGERWKIGVNLDHPSVTVETRPMMIRVIRGGRSPVDGDAPRAWLRSAARSVNAPGLPAKKTTRLSPSTSRETSPRGRRSEVPTGASWPSSKAVRRDRPLVLDESQLKPR